MACLRSRALQTSFRPFTRPIKERGVQHVFSQSETPSILVQIGHRSSRIYAQVLTVVCLGLFDHTLDGISDVVGLFLFLGHFDLLVFFVAHLNTVSSCK